MLWKFWKQRARPLPWPTSGIPQVTSPSCRKYVCICLIHSPASTAREFLHCSPHPQHYWPILWPQSAFRTLLGIFMVKEKVIMESGICPHLSVSMDEGGNWVFVGFFFFTQKKSSDLSKADFCLLLILLITSQGKCLLQCCKVAEAQPQPTQRVSELPQWAGS